MKVIGSPEISQSPATYPWELAVREHMLPPRTIAVWAWFDGLAMTGSADDDSWDLYVAQPGPWEWKAHGGGIMSTSDAEPADLVAQAQALLGNDQPLRLWPFLYDIEIARNPAWSTYPAFAVRPAIRWSRASEH